MHNEYVTTCCILNKRDKLLLLKYSDVDITRISGLLKPLVINLMDQCYNHVENFHKLNKLKNKKYHKLEPLVAEQLKDMLFVKKKFIEFFSGSGKKTKEDLFTYIFAFQISDHYFNEYLYRIIIDSLKEDFTPEFWEKYNLGLFELNNLGFSDFYILRDKEEECSTGTFDIDLKPSIEVVNNFNDCNSDIEEKIDNKLNNVKILSMVLNNYYNKDVVIFNEPYKEYITELVDNIKVSKNFEKPKRLIKRI